MSAHDQATSRPTPAWYDDAKLGIFIHWGLYSVPGWAPTTGTLDEAPTRLGWQAWFRDNPYAEWYCNSLRIADSPTARHHRATYGDAPYEAFVPVFNEALRRWDPAAMADLIRGAGARYVVLTTKHHDGFRLWPSRVPHPTLGDYHAARDVVGELASAVRAAGLRFGTYYSGGLDWSFNERPISDIADLGETVIQDPAYAAYADAHWRELIDRYETIILWNDIGYPRRSDLTTIVADFYRRYPDGLVNDRFQDIRGVGDRVPLVPPDFDTPEYTTHDEIRAGKFEANRGIGYSFGYNQNEDESNFIPIPTLIHFLADVVSKNGNLLLNIGPYADGSVQEGQIARLRALGAWLAVYGEAIYATRPWQTAEGTTDSGLPVRFTRTADALYAIVLGSPQPGPLTIAGLRATPATRVTLLGHDGPLPTTVAGGLRVELPSGLPADPAFALRITPLPTPGR